MLPRLWMLAPVKWLPKALDTDQRNKARPPVPHAFRAVNTASIDIRDQGADLARKAV